MRILIVPDIHEKIYKVKHILSSFKYDRAVFLGDYFDKFGKENTEETCDWLNEVTQIPEYTFLLGNHDQHYFFGIEKCSGYTEEKHKLITSKISSPTINKFKLIHWEGNWLLSHAGVDTSFIRWDLPTIDDQADKALELAKQGSTHPLFKAGMDRGGRAAIGGCTWIDWRSLEITDCMNQIVGHSFGKEVRFKNSEKAQSACIDTGLEHIAILDDEQLKIIKVSS